MNLSNREVLFAKLHTTIHVPGLGELNTRLANTELKLKSIKMQTSTEGLFCQVGKVEFVVPWANVQVMTVAPEASDAPVVLSE